MEHWKKTGRSRDYGLRDSNLMTLGGVETVGSGRVLTILGETETVGSVRVLTTLGGVKTVKLG